MRNSAYSLYFISKRDITPSKIDAKWQHSNLICGTWNYSRIQTFSSKCHSMKGGSAETGGTETQTESRTDGHHRIVIDPVWRRAYKNESVYKIIIQSMLMIFVGRFCFRGSKKNKFFVQILINLISRKSRENNGFMMIDWTQTHNVQKVS